jgi:hypothetical protein
VQWTLLGDERTVIDRLNLAGADVREVKPLALEDAAVAFLAEEISQ